MFVSHAWVLILLLVVGWCAVVGYLVSVLVGRARRGSLGEASEQRNDPGARSLAWRAGRGH